MLTKSQVDSSQILDRAKTIMRNYKLNKQIAERAIDISGVDYSNEKVQSSPKSNPTEDSFTDYVQIKAEVDQIDADIKKLSRSRPREARLIKTAYMTTSDESPNRTARGMNISVAQYYKRVDDALLHFAYISTLVPIILKKQ